MSSNKCFKTRRMDVTRNQGLFPKIIVLTNKSNNLHIRPLYFGGVCVLGERTFWPVQVTVFQTYSLCRRPSSEPPGPLSPQKEDGTGGRGLAPFTDLPETEVLQKKAVNGRQPAVMTVAQVWENVSHHTNMDRACPWDNDHDRANVPRSYPGRCRSPHADMSGDCPWESDRTHTRARTWPVPTTCCDPLRGRGLYM